MRIPTISFALAAILIIISCNNDQDCCLPIDELDNLIGSWQVYERGYSPGSGYIVDGIPDDPAQILTFKSDNQFSSNYAGLEDFTYYLIIPDGTGGYILALYKNILDMKDNHDINTLTHSYNIQIEDGNVKLYFRYCIEGCHIGLKKVG